ncbi:unnamed protein product, partial [Natator depressus]
MRLSVAAAISHGRVHRRLGLGPRSRLDMLRNLVTALVRHERIETHWARADEMRVYAERLIDYAKRGDADEAAMRMADFWLTEKDLIHKLFKLLAPRFQAHSGNYTRLLQIPKSREPGSGQDGCDRIQGESFPPLIVLHRDNEKTLLNQLLKGYREDVLKTRATQAPEGLQPHCTQELQC